MIRFTKLGLEKLKNNLKNLVDERPKAVSELKKARDMGDLSENGYYKAARSKLSTIDYEIRKFAYEIKNAVVVENNNKNNIDIGSIVTLKNEDRKVTYYLVGDLEAKPSENKISLLSPIGRAIFGKIAGDKIIINTPSGKINYRIEEIS